MVWVWSIKRKKKKKYQCVNLFQTEPENYQQIMHLNLLLQNLIKKNCKSNIASFCKQSICEEIFTGYLAMCVYIHFFFFPKGDVCGGGHTCTLIHGNHLNLEEKNFVSKIWFCYIHDTLNQIILTDCHWVKFPQAKFQHFLLLWLRE